MCQKASTSCSSWRFRIPLHAACHRATFINLGQREGWDIPCMFVGGRSPPRAAKKEADSQESHEKYPHGWAHVVSVRLKPSPSPQDQVERVPSCKRREEYLQRSRQRVRCYDTTRRLLWPSWWKLWEQGTEKHDPAIDSRVLCKFEQGAPWEVLCFPTKRA